MGNRSKGRGKGPFKRRPNNYGPPCTNVTYTRDEVVSFNLATIEGREKLDKYLESVTRINNKIRRFAD